MTIETNIRFSEELITQLSKEKNEPDWMLDLRLKAFDLYKDQPIPFLGKTKIASWNIEQFNPYVKEMAAKELRDIPAEAQALVTGKEDSNVLVQKNSSVIYQQLTKSLTEQGVIFTELDNAIQEYPDLIKKYFMKSFSGNNDKLINLHTALWSGGVFLYIPKNVQVKLPIQALFLAEKAGILPHVLIVAEANSSVTYVDNYIAMDNCEAAVHNGVVELYVGENAQVRYATIHNLPSQFYDYTCRKATVARSGKIEWIIGEMNSAYTVSSNTSILEGTAAEADTKSIFIGTGKQRVNLESKVCHVGEHTTSNILSRGVLLDSSVAIFSGITKIEKGAAKSNAAQAEKVLMLSDSAHGEANPILLIDEHDVMAGHAASAGPVNPNDIFYLMSRGISKQEAERLIINGFLTPVVSRIPLSDLREQLQKVIERKLVR